MMIEPRFEEEPPDFFVEHIRLDGLRLHRLGLLDSGLDENLRFKDLQKILFKYRVRTDDFSGKVMVMVLAYRQLFPFGLKPNLVFTLCHACEYILQ